MFSRVSIKNFKSIRDLEFEARRVNVFIGEPNTGKSNLVEALAVFSEGTYDSGAAFQDLLRFKTVPDLFFDRELSEEASVSADGFQWSLKLEGSSFKGRIADAKGVSGEFQLTRADDLRVPRLAELPVRYYRFNPLVPLGDTRFGALRAPYGSNLAGILTTNKRLRRLVGDLFREKGFRLVIDTEKRELMMAKEVDEQLYNFSYPTISETLRRIVFFMAVLETNQNAILLLDEPEANTFPFYTTYLAERIALDEANQFFLTTHNPYVLGSIVAKTPVEQLAVFVTTMESYRTRLKVLSREGLSKILDYGADAFLNLERLTGE